MSINPDQVETLGTVNVRTGRGTSILQNGVIHGRQVTIESKDRLSLSDLTIRSQDALLNIVTINASNLVSE